MTCGVAAHRAISWTLVVLGVTATCVGVFLFVRPHRPFEPCGVRNLVDYLLLLKRYKTGNIVPITTAGKIGLSPPIIFDITIIRIAVTVIIVTIGRYFFIL